MATDDVVFPTNTSDLPYFSLTSNNLSQLRNEDFYINALKDSRLKQYNTAEITFVTIIMPCILFIGLVTNITFLFVVYRVSWMQTNVNTYLFHLAIADILFLTVGSCDKLWHYSQTPFVWDEAFRGTAGCVLTDLVTDSAYFTGLCLITMVSIHRFNAVCRPHSGSHQQTMAGTRRWVAGAWLCGILLSSTLIPSHCVMDVFTLPQWPDTPYFNHLPDEIGFCDPVQKWVGIMANLIQTVPFFLAMTVNTFLYVRIILSLNHIVDKGSEFGCKDVNERIRNRVTKMLVTNGCVFFLCLFPFELSSFLMSVAGTLIEESWFYGFRTLLYVNSTVNPIIYGITNSKYRKAYALAYSFCRKKSGDMVRYELSIPLNRMKDRPTAVTDCRVRGGDS